MSTKLLFGETRSHDPSRPTPSDSIVAQMQMQMQMDMTPLLDLSAERGNAEASLVLLVLRSARDTA
jgi:hypothetical protein